MCKKYLDSCFVRLALHLAGRHVRWASLRGLHTQLGEKVILYPDACLQQETHDSAYVRLGQVHKEDCQPHNIYGNVAMMQLTQTVLAHKFLHHAWQAHKTCCTEAHSLNLLISKVGRQEAAAGALN